MKIGSLVIVIYLTAIFPQHLLAKDYIGHCRNYPPELYFEDQTCIGAVPELVNDIFSELGHNIIWIKAPWLRSVKDAEEGRVDLLIRHSMTPERTKYLQAIKYSYRIRQLSFYKSPALKSEINSYDDLQRVIVGAIRGAYYSPNFSKLDTSRFMLLEQTEQLVSMLKLGRIDIAVSSSSHNKDLFERQFTEITFSESFINPLYISIPKTSPAMEYYDEIAQLMMDYRKSGKINQYFEKYGLVLPEQIYP